MAFVSLVSTPPTPVLDKNMTDSELAEDEREDGELEDGEIDDEGIGIEEETKEVKEVNEEKEKEKEKGKEKEKEKEKEDKTHRHSRKRYKKTREKRRSKRRRRDRQKHHSPSSSSSSDSYDSDLDRAERERPKSKKSQGSMRDPDSQSAQGRESRGSHSNTARSPQHKYSDYSEEGEGEEYPEEQGDYRQGREAGSPSQARGRQAKDQMKKGSMRGMQKQQQQFSGQRGRGRGGGVARGRGIINKNKKLKGKSWGRGRGRGTDLGGEGMNQEGRDMKGPPGFQKKRPIMTKEFINQHTVEHNGRYICKYFLEGRCIKGEQCKFEHELVVPDKKRELCKFYLQGYCSKGDHCIYMHSEYPCKFFHTGAKCYQGDNCKFSHEPLTDVTKELLDKIINIEEEIAHEDELELEDLRKQGIAPLPKPPPGVGLLPTPGPSSPTEGGSGPGPGPGPAQGGKKIPSLFEIKVQPTVDLAQKIGLSGSNFSPSGSQFQGEGGNSQFEGGPEDMQSGGMIPQGPNGPPIPPSGSPGPMGTPPPSHTGPPMPQSPPGPFPPPGFPMPPPGPPPTFLGNRPQMNMQGPPFPPMPDLQMLQNLPFPGLCQNMGPNMGQNMGLNMGQNMGPNMGQNMGPNPAEFFSNFFRSQGMGPGVDLSLALLQSSLQQGGAEPQIQSLPPAVQKALFFHLSQQQGQEQQQGHMLGQGQGQMQHGQMQQGQEPQVVKGQNAGAANRDKDEPTNWYSSDEEEGSCVTAILRSLKKQSEKQQPPQPGPDPRLLKDRAPPSDPRTKVDPRQRPPDQRREAEAAGDPRLARDPRKLRAPAPSSFRPDGQRPQQPGRTGPGEEDEDGERELRDRAALIPLEASPGVVLRDPRSQLQQFSHIRVDILLQRPAWAHAVVWAPEDLIPLLVPRQDPSINLPLPPLIADAQMNRSSLPDHPPHPVSSPPPIDPRLAAARLKEGIGARLSSRGSTERPLDPRHHKALDPRLGRSTSLDSKPPCLREASSGGGAGDPRLHKGSTGSSTSQTPAPPALTRAEPERLPPYAPRLASGGGLEGLGGISLYDPRNQAAQPHKEETEMPRKGGILKQPDTKPDRRERENLPPPLSLSPSGKTAPASDVEAREADSSSSDSSRPQPPLAASPEPPSTPAQPPALHHLPIQALAGLIRPPYTDPRQARQGVQGQGGPQGEEEGEKEREVTEEEKEAEEADDRPLKDVFKTFDPTASPFCQ